MVLEKGFLRRPKQFVSKQRLISGILLGTAFSYILYIFFYYMREFHRMATGLCYNCFLVELTAREHYYYNLFYGSVSAVIGLYFIFIFTLENSINLFDKKLKLKQRAILNDQRFFKWSFLSAFMRMTSIIGFWFITIPMQFDIDILKNFSLLLLLIPIVLFLNIWPMLLKNIGKMAYRWVLFSFLYVLVLGFGYANINFIDYRSMDHNLKKNNIESVYPLQVPTANSFQIIDFELLASHIYVVKDSSNQGQPKILFHHDYINSQDVELTTKIEWAKSYDSFRDRTIINLHIDKSMSLEVVNNLKEELRKSGVRSIQYSTGINNSKYPPRHLKYAGIPQYLEPPYYASLATFLDSAENLDFTKRTLRLPESPMYRFHKLREHHYIKINITPEKAFLNGREISDEKLRNVLYKFIKGYSPNYNIILEPDEDIEYGRYIFYLDMIHSAIVKLRHQLSYQLFNEPFDNNRRASGYDTIVGTYPANIMEWSPEEKRLIELVKRSGFVR